MSDASSNTALLYTLLFFVILFGTIFIIHYIVQLMTHHPIVSELIKKNIVDMFVTLKRKIFSRYKKYSLSNYSLVMSHGLVYELSELTKTKKVWNIQVKIFNFTGHNSILKIHSTRYYWKGLPEEFAKMNESFYLTKDSVLCIDNKVLVKTRKKPEFISIECSIDNHDKQHVILSLKNHDHQNDPQIKSEKKD